MFNREKNSSTIGFARIALESGKLALEGAAKIALAKPLSVLEMLGGRVLSLERSEKISNYVAKTNSLLLKDSEVAAGAEHSLLAAGSEDFSIAGAIIKMALASFIR